MKHHTNFISRQSRIGRKVVSCLLLSLALAACAPDAPSIMSPAGPASRAIAQLGWLFFILGGLVFVVVMAYLAYALGRKRSRLTDQQAGTKVVIYGGMIIPAIILLVLFVLNTNVLGQVSAPNEENVALVVEVTGRQWWWEVHYPDYDFETANEIHIPVGKPVRLQLQAEDVIHSFWVPELHGKMDMIPGRVNDFWIQADEAGTYKGECAEYCGKQHAKMQFLVIAHNDADFEAWTAQMQQPVDAAASSEAVQKGLEVFMTSTCISCHAIEGTEATGDLGPDLTHLGSRRMIGAGTVPLTRANLGGWIANPQGIKPGAKMPPSNLSGEDLNALIDFLMEMK